MNRILIIGCGYVGQALANLYLSKGAEVWALQRNPVNIQGIRNILCDITLISKDILPEVDIIFYLVSPDSSSESSYVNVYDKGLNKLICALKAKNNPKLILSTSTRVYGQCQGEEVDETFITQPKDIQGKILLDAESSVLSTPHNTVVRLGGIYGPGRTKLLEEIRKNEIKLSPVPVYTNRIHLSDCVGILNFLATKNLNSIFNGVDSHPTLYNELILWLASKLNAPQPEVGDNPPSRLINSNKRCLNHKIITHGYQLHYPTFKEGYENVLYYL